MDLATYALPLIVILAVTAFAWARQPEPARDPDEVERGSTTVMPEDR